MQTADMIARTVLPGLENVVTTLNDDWRYLIVVLALVVLGAKRKKNA